MPEPLLELLEATVVKDGRPVLDRVSLTIREGEHTAILGPNGAGKSVLVGLLTHHERAVPHDDGRPAVRVLGEARWDVGTLRRRLGIISSALHHRLVAGNSEGPMTARTAVVSAFLASHGILRYGAVTDEMQARALTALDEVGAVHLADRYLHQMSGGEARRVLLARVMVTEPRVLVLDEPTTGLDLAARHDFMERVRHVTHEGTTLVLVTHHTEEIVPEVGRVIFLRDGRIAGDGPTERMLAPDPLRQLFGTPVVVDRAGPYAYARPAGAAAARP
ncbi:MAG: ATP-binding cassette domain-containing protein [Vicinamibacterales bacterium]